MFHLHCDYILPALLNTIFVSSNRIQCLNFVLYNDLISGEKKLCVDDPVALTGGCYKFVSKWTYMCMLWKFTPCFSWYHMAEMRAFFSFLSFWRCTLWPKPCPNTQTSRSAWPQVGDVIYLFICHFHLSVIYLWSLSVYQGILNL